MTVPVDGVPDDAVVVDGGRAVLEAVDAAVVEQALARGDALLLGGAVAVDAIMLRAVVTSLARGRAFGAGNSRRLYALSGAVAVGGLLGPLLPQVGTMAVLHRLDLAFDGPLDLEGLV